MKTGRKSKKDEALIMAVVNKSWQLVHDILFKTGRSMEKKEMVAMEVVKRTAPKNIDLTTMGEKIVCPIYGGKSNISVSGHTSNKEGISAQKEN